MKVVHTRLDESTHKMIEELARHYKTDMSTVMRWAAEAIIDYADMHGGKIILPLKFGETLIDKAPPPKKKTKKAKRARGKSGTLGTGTEEEASQ
jgi:hypothetical protein